MTISCTFLDAVTRGDDALVESMLRDEPSLAMTRAESGETAIQRAAYRSHASTLRLLLGSGPVLDLATACTVGDQAAVDSLIANDPALVNELSQDGFLPLCLAVAFGHLAVVDQLLAGGAKLDLRSRALGVAPMDSAIFGRCAEIVRRLLEHGADPNIPQGASFYPLHGAAQHGDVATIRVLLEYGADKTVVTDAGKSPYDFALAGGHADAAELLRLE